MEKQIKKLKELDSCSSAMVWVKDQTNPQQAWNTCERGDWMLWLLDKLSGGSRSKSRKLLVLTACECARLSLKYVPKGEGRPLKAIETAEAWTKGKATLEQVRNAADAAAAADAAYAAYAAYADAAYAAYAAAAAAYAAAYTADAAYAAYAAADAADADADAADAAYARKNTLKQCADIVRKHYPIQPLK